MAPVWPANARRAWVAARDPRLTRLYMLARAVRGACSERRADRRHREAARGRRQSQLLRSRNAAVNANALGRKQRSCERHREACRAGCQVCVPASRGPSFPSPCARPSALRCGGGVCATCCPRVRDTAPTRAHLCRRTRTHARTHACMHARTHARTHARMQTHAHTNTHAHTHCTHARAHARAHTVCIRRINTDGQHCTMQPTGGTWTASKSCSTWVPTPTRSQRVGRHPWRYEP